MQEIGLKAKEKIEQFKALTGLEIEVSEIEDCYEVLLASDSLEGGGIIVQANKEGALVGGNFDGFVNDSIDYVIRKAKSQLNLA